MTGKSNRRLGWLVAIACALLLAGCYEDPDFTDYEPGIYKGAPDPLLAKLESEELPAKLQQRFTRVQTYR